MSRWSEPLGFPSPGPDPGAARRTPVHLVRTSPVHVARAASHLARAMPAHLARVAAVLALALVLLGPSAGASAEPTPTDRRTTAPVESIRAPVVDIVTTTSDLGGEARVEESRTSVRVTLDATVLFGRDSATLRPRARGRLDEVAATLRARGPGRVRIVGYTDDLGSAAHGLELSRRRARAVAALLRGELPPGTYQFTVLGRGEADPVVPNTSEPNRRMNRRVVVSYGGT